MNCNEGGSSASSSPVTAHFQARMTQISGKSAYDGYDAGAVPQCKSKKQRGSLITNLYGAKLMSRIKRAVSRRRCFSKPQTMWRKISWRWRFQSSQGITCVGSEPFLSPYASSRSSASAGPEGAPALSSWSCRPALRPSRPSPQGGDRCCARRGASLGADLALRGGHAAAQ
eukprot:s5283_g6.t2